MPAIFQDRYVVVVFPVQIVPEPSQEPVVNAMNQANIWMEKLFEKLEEARREDESERSWYEPNPWLEHTGWEKHIREYKAWVVQQTKEKIVNPEGIEGVDAAGEAVQENERVLKRYPRADKNLASAESSAEADDLPSMKKGNSSIEDVRGPHLTASSSDRLDAFVWVLVSMERLRLRLDEVRNTLRAALSPEDFTAVEHAVEASVPPVLPRLQTTTKKFNVGVGGNKAVRYFSPSINT
ncbi:hypothetical protein LTR95_004829 [Oleoguttula sp. CCFEE 5521]